MFLRRVLSKYWYTWLCSKAICFRDAICASLGICTCCRNTGYLICKWNKRATQWVLEHGMHASVRGMDLRNSVRSIRERERKTFVTWFSDIKVCLKLVKDLTRVSGWWRNVTFQKKRVLSERNVSIFPLKKFFSPFIVRIPFWEKLQLFCVVLQRERIHCFSS